MKIIIIALLSASLCYSQDTIDRDWYVKVTPIQLYNTSGNINDRLSYNIESGISLNMLDIGIAYGKVYNRPDTANYMEAKFIMDASQYGIFSNEFGLGMGYIFNAKANTLFEANYTIQAQVLDKLGIGISVCYYDFTGRYYNVSQVGYGVFIRYGSGRDESGFLTSSRTKKRFKI